MSAGDVERPAATVLVTAAGAAPALAFVRGLRAQSELAARIVGVDTTARSSGLFDCDARYTVPRVDDGDFQAAIEAICAAERVDVLAPIADFELELFAELAPALEERTGAKVITNAPDAVRLARDKRRSAEVVAASGVAVPEVYDGSGPQPPELPVIVKPAAGAGSHGVSVVRRAEELAPALALAGQGAVVQEFIEGEEHTVDLVVAPDGEVLAAAPRIRVEVRAGQSYKSVTVDDPEIEDAARACARALGITAQANVQLIKSSRDGRPYFVEVNPKFAAAMGLTIGAGLNIPLLYVKLALGLAVRPEELRRRSRTWLLRCWQDRVVSEEEMAAVPAWDSVARARHPIA